MLDSFIVLYTVLFVAWLYDSDFETMQKSVLFYFVYLPLFVIVLFCTENYLREIDTQDFKEVSIKVNTVHRCFPDSYVEC